MVFEKACGNGKRRERLRLDVTMQTRDIRPEKGALRTMYKQMRLEVASEIRTAWDEEIRRRVMRLWQYRRRELLLTYVSTAIEVDTWGLMRQAMADGKRVAVPRCVPGTREMAFYLIQSFDQMEPGAFGVMEPVPERCERLTDFSRGLCIVPGLAYDWAGYRLGYGKGYYDRFLSAFGGDMVGVCYGNCVQRRLPHGRFDRAVDVLVTERYVRGTKRS